MTAKSGAKLIIIGDSAIAEVAYEYFTHDSPYEVAAFAVEREYLTRSELFGVPVVAYEDIATAYPAATHDAFVAIGFAQMNRLRARLYRQTKEKGYRLASYVSSQAFVWRNVKIGDNCFIFENNVVQPFVSIGDNVTLWSGNHIGHHSKIGDHVFISSHVVISGFVDIGPFCFFGVNASVGHKVKVAANDLIGAGALIVRDTEPRRMYVAEQTKPRTVDTLTHFGISE